MSCCGHQTYSKKYPVIVAGMPKNKPEGLNSAESVGVLSIAAPEPVAGFALLLLLLISR